MRQLRATRGRKVDVTKLSAPVHERHSCMMCLSFDENKLVCRRYGVSCGTALIHEELCGPDRKGRVTMDDI